MITQTLLHKLNNLLSGVVIILGVYILFTPLFAEVFYQVTKQVHATSPQKKVEQVTKENRLIIPEIGVNAEILEGESADILDKGIWHRPHTSTPDKGGNTVLVGHRYLYTSGPKTFYLLPKLKKGDIITVFWNTKKYEYTVKEIHIVSPTAIDIEAPTTQSQLILYTCTPLWNPIQRYVVKAFPNL